MFIECLLCAGTRDHKVNEREASLHSRSLHSVVVQVSTTHMTFRYRRLGSDSVEKGDKGEEKLGRAGEKGYLSGWAHAEASWSRRPVTCEPDLQAGRTLRTRGEEVWMPRSLQATRTRVTAARLRTVSGEGTGR